jgi:hypothetical protein
VEAHPTMTRAGDAVSRFLAREVPASPVDAEFAAKLATLLRAGG